MNAHATLTGEYAPAAVYYDLADAVEYIRSDEPCIYRRVDGLLTLAISMDNKKVIGFRIKGFKNFYLRELKPICDKLGIPFVDLTTAFANLIQKIGDETFDEERRWAYQQAYEIASNDNVKLLDLPVAA